MTFCILQEIKNHFMKFSITLLIIIASHGLFSQCDFQVNGVDKFTGRKLVRTKEHKAFATAVPNQFIEFSFGKIDTVRFVQLHLGRSGKPFYVGKGDKCIIIFDDGSKANLILNYFSDVADGGGFYHIDVRYQLTKDQLSKFQNKKIADIRVYLSNGTIQHEGVKSKHATKIQNLAKCID